MIGAGFSQACEPLAVPAWHQPPSETVPTEESTNQFSRSKQARFERLPAHSGPRSTCSTVGRTLELELAHYGPQNSRCSSTFRQQRLLPANPTGGPNSPLYQLSSSQRDLGAAASQYVLLSCCAERRHGLSKSSTLLSSNQRAARLMAASWPGIKCYQPTREPPCLRVLEGAPFISQETAASFSCLRIAGSPAAETPFLTFVF